MSGDSRARRLAAVDNVTSDDHVDLTARCARPNCRREFMPSGGRGRPRLYCSSECGEAADAEHKTAQATVRHYERLLRDARTDLATFGRGREVDASSSVEIAESARRSWSRADGAARFAQAGDLGLLEILRELLATTEPLLGPSSPLQR